MRENFRFESRRDARADERQRVTVFTANHLSLIRSFLLDCGLSTPSREATCAKLFCSAHKRDRHANAREKMRITENFAHACASRANFARARNPYFIVTF
jgi:hypothetical protein